METNFQPPSTSMLELTANEVENEINQELNDSELDAIASKGSFTRFKKSN